MVLLATTQSDAADDRPSAAYEPSKTLADDRECRAPRRWASRSRAVAGSTGIPVLPPS